MVLKQHQKTCKIKKNKIKRLKNCISKIHATIIIIFSYLLDVERWEDLKMQNVLDADFLEEH